MTIAGILFDKDGTLLDYHRTWMPANRRAALAVAGGDADLAARLLALGGYDAGAGRVGAGSPLAAWSNAEIAALWAAQVPGGDALAATALVEAIFVESGRDGAVPVTDLAALFARLRDRGLRLGVATSDSAEGARASLGRFGVLEQLDFIAGYDSGHGSKPGPDMVHGFCAATGLPTTRVAVVGDNTHDLEMGRAAGAALVVGVLSGTGARDDLGALADHLLADITELESLLDRVG